MLAFTTSFSSRAWRNGSVPDLHSGRRSSSLLARTKMGPCESKDIQEHAGPRISGAAERVALLQ